MLERQREREEKIKAKEQALKEKEIRAQQLREYFDTLLKNIGFSYINGN